jgi:hypothetical protein
MEEEGLLRADDSHQCRVQDLKAEIPHHNQQDGAQNQQPDRKNDFKHVINRLPNE